MHTRSSGLWPLRLSTLALAALAAASATFWALKWRTPVAWQHSTAPATAAGEAPGNADLQAVTRLLGAAAPEAGAPASESQSSRFKLTGVVVYRPHHGYAVIAVDEQSARPFGVGSQVAQGLVLQSVSPRGAVLAPSRQAPAAITLELPPLSKP